MIKPALALLFVVILGCSSGGPRFANGEATALVRQDIIEHCGRRDVDLSGENVQVAGYHESYTGGGVWSVYFPDSVTVEAVDRIEWRVYEATATVELVAGPPCGD